MLIAEAGAKSSCAGAWPLCGKDKAARQSGTHTILLGKVEGGGSGSSGWLPSVVDDPKKVKCRVTVRTVLLSRDVMQCVPMLQLLHYRYNLSSMQRVLHSVLKLDGVELAMCFPSIGKQLFHLLDDPEFEVAAMAVLVHAGAAAQAHPVLHRSLLKYLANTRDLFTPSTYLHILYLARYILASVLLGGEPTLKIATQALLNSLSFIVAAAFFSAAQVVEHVDLPYAEWMKAQENSR